MSTATLPATISSDPAARPSVRFHLGYRPWLDGLRALSVLLVLAVHLRLVAPETAPLLPAGGFLGVDVFFVISGFLITSLLLDEYDKSNSISLKAFYWRRALRLLPALVTVVLFVCLLALLLGSFAAVGLTEIRVASIVGYFTNWLRVYEGNETWIFFHLWSLSVEEQFYLVWPALLVVLLALRIGPRWIFRIVVIGITVSALLKPVLFFGGSGVNRIYYGSDTRADSILIGCAVSLAFACGYFKAISTRVTAAIARAAAIMFIALIALADDGFRPLYFGGLTTASLCVAAIILHLALIRSSSAFRFLEHPTVLWVGKRSYGLYLWHWPMFEIARSWAPSVLVIPIALLSTFFVAAVSYRFIESPFLKMKRSVPIAEALASRIDAISPRASLPNEAEV